MAEPEQGPLVRAAGAAWAGLVALARVAGRTVGARQALVLVLVLGAGVAAGATWLASEVYEDVAGEDGVAALDQPVLEAMVGARSAWSEALVTAYTTVGGAVVMPVLAVAAMLWLSARHRSWTPVILVSAAGAGSLLMTAAGKDLVGRARPELADAVPPYESSPSFPSGHSLNGLVVAGIVAYLLVRRQRSWRARALTVSVAAVFAVTMGLSRVFLGHHWLTDVVAAWLLGAGWLAAVVTAHRLYLTVHRREGPPAPTVEPDMAGDDER